MNLSSDDEDAAAIADDLSHDDDDVVFLDEKIDDQCKTGLIAQTNPLRVRSHRNTLTLYE
jgi:hypothetical protein